MLLDKRAPIAYFFNLVKYEMLIVFLLGFCNHILTEFVFLSLPVMPLTIATFLGTAISILLSFKMSQSYERWWEARKIWGAIVNDSRSLVMQLQAFVKEDGDQNSTKTIAYRQIAWCYSLGQSLRGLSPIANCDTFLSSEDMEHIKSFDNKTLGILQLNTQLISRLRDENKINNYENIQLNSTIVRLTDSMGAAERINSTVFPTTYKMFLHFTIYLFVLILSVALKDVRLIFELPLFMLVSFVFFMLEKTAYHLQDPFRNRPSDIPVTAIARTIEINIRQLLKEEIIPDPIAKEEFYIM
jgi:putative membrane protein